LQVACKKYFSTPLPDNPFFLFDFQLIAYIIFFLFCNKTGSILLQILIAKLLLFLKTTIPKKKNSGKISFLAVFQNTL
jgi:hypothetical protein